MSASINLSGLPPDLLFKIFGFINNKDPVKQVCKDFHKTVCKIELEKIRLFIDKENFLCDELLTKSQRVFDEVRINTSSSDESAIIKLKGILKPRQDDLTKITFEQMMVTDQVMIELLNLLPNLSNIIIDVKILFGRGSSQLENQRLSGLKKVRSMTVNFESAGIILDLPKDVLRKLSFHGPVRNVQQTQNELRQIFACQSSIVDLTIETGILLPDMLVPLKLQRISLITSEHIQSMLFNQPYIEHLDVKHPITFEAYTTICNFESLQSLSIDVSNVDQSMLFDIGELITLKELKITLPKNSEYFIFTLINLPFLEKLHLIASLDDTDETIERLPRNFPALKHLSLAMVSSKTISNLLLNSKALRTLDIAKLYGPSEEDARNSYWDMFAPTSHNNISEFSVGTVSQYSETFDRFFRQLFTQKLKNLIKLRLNDIKIINSIEMLENIMIAQQRLSYISINSTMPLDGHFKDFLMRYCNNLMYFEIRDFPPLHLTSIGDPGPAVQGIRTTFKTQFSCIDYNLKRLILKNCNWEQEKK